MKKGIPLYNILNIEKSVHPNILVERLNGYLAKHYEHLNRPHRHSFFHLVLFTSGEGTHTIDFESFKIAPYQIYFMVPGQVHSWHFKTEMQGYIVHFEPEFFTSFLQKHDYINRFSFFSGSSHDSVFAIPKNQRAEIRELFEKLLDKIATGAFDFIKVLLLELFMQVERCCAPERKTDGQSSNVTLINHFRQLVEKHYHTLKLPKQYAQLLYITPNHLNAVCQDVAGKSAGDLIRDRVILEAKRLLTNADMDVSEIAYELNFEDNSYFTRFFKKYVGATPEQFRKTITR